MRLFTADSPDTPPPRTDVPATLLRRLAFGRPLRRTIQPAQPAAPRTENREPEAADPRDLDQRVRESGEW